jgi:hypothetical protein
VDVKAQALVDAGSPRRAFPPVIVGQVPEDVVLEVSVAELVVGLVEELVVVSFEVLIEALIVSLRVALVGDNDVV